MPTPSPTRTVSCRTRRKFYYSLRLLLVPTLVREIIIFLEYMSFSRFQYELLVHTPNTDVYRRILECRFTHFAPYVVHIETAVIVRTLPRPSTLTHMVDVQQFIRSQIAERYILQYHYCSTSQRGEEPIARLIFWRCQAQGL